jgi:DNA polymerase-3 subunit gamma/tau
MAYRALYRAWRPRRFGDLVGQEHVARTLRNAVSQGRVAHAYLFCGPRGTGKTSAARILAQAVNCDGPRDGEPCGACPSCRRVEDEQFLDIIEIDAASNRGIDEMRDLREKVRYAPGSGRCKVYIVDEVHMLTEHAWNAFLKTLEEPPERTVFVLATTDPHKVPLTVLSRCQRFDFRRLTAEQIASRLARVCRGEGLAVAPDALAAIARRSEGGMRDALSLLDQGLSYAGDALTAADVALIAGAAEEEVVERLLACVATGDAAAVLAEVERLYLAGRDLSVVARDLAQGARGRLVASLKEGGATADLWLRGAELLADVELAVRRTAQPRLLVEVTLLRWLRGASPQPQALPASIPAGSPTGPAFAAPVAATAEAWPPRDASGGRAGVPAPGAPPSGGAAGPGGRDPGPESAHTPSPPPGREDPDATLGSSSDPTPPAGWTLADVRAAWPRVVAALGRIERAAQRVFEEARPLAVEGGKLTLALQRGYHLVAPNKRAALEKAFASAIGACPGLEFVADGETAATPTESSERPSSRRGAPGDPRPPRASGPAGSLHDEALDVFEGEAADPPGFDAGGGHPGLW